MVPEQIVHPARMETQTGEQVKKEENVLRCDVRLR